MRFEETAEKGIYTCYSDSGGVYTVCNKWCTCPHYKGRMAKIGGRCKHMNNLNATLSTEAKLSEGIKREDIIAYIKEHPSHDQVTSHFGNDVLPILTHLLNDAEILYERKRDSYVVLE